MPNYALSNAYEPDSTASNQDIDGLMYPDMPWMVSSDRSIDEIRNTIAQAWDNRAAWRSRLFAFGYDACQLMVAMSAKGQNPADIQVGRPHRHAAPGCRSACAARPDLGSDPQWRTTPARRARAQLIRLQLIRLQLIRLQTQQICELTRTAAAHTLASMKANAINRVGLGIEAEQRAAALLERAGFRVLRRNYHCRTGELDIVAQRQELLVVAEVRMRTREDFGGAAGSITEEKRRRIVRATRNLLRRQPALAELYVRFDILLLSEPGGPVDWIEAAFDA